MKTTPAATSPLKNPIVHAYSCLKVLPHSFVIKAQEITRIFAGKQEGADIYKLPATINNNLLMMTLRITIIMPLIISNSMLKAQNCEDFNKSLFYMLPDTMPNRINCVDTLGLKQGWWINYTLRNNPNDIPDVLKKGDYVDSYSYGKYLDNLKIGDWISVANVHLIYEKQKVNYYYSKDTIMITTFDGPWKESIIYYNSDSTIINSTILPYAEKYPIVIECDKNGDMGNECIMTYRNEMIKKFSFEQFNFEFNRSLIAYTIEKIRIDNGLME